MKRCKDCGQPIREYKRSPAFDRKGLGVEVQEYGLAEDHSVVCAGVHWIPEITARYLWKLCNNWRRWRRWYDHLPENRRRNYPAKLAPTVKFWGVHPIDNPSKQTWITV